MSYDGDIRRLAKTNGWEIGRTKGRLVHPKVPQAVVLPVKSRDPRAIKNARALLKRALGRR